MVAPRKNLGQNLLEHSKIGCSCFTEVYHRLSNLQSHFNGFEQNSTKFVAQLYKISRLAFQF